MDVVIAGGHGQVGRLLGRRLAHDGDSVRGLIRAAEQASDLTQDGVTPVVLDLESADEEQLADAIAGADAVVFAAGAGPGSGAERKQTVDHQAAVNLLAAARRAGVVRYVMVSSMGADDPPADDDVFSVYLRAKARADQSLMESDRAWTIVRPGRLTDDAPTGQVTLGASVGRGAISRADVAHVLAAVLREPASSHNVVEVISGDIPIQQAVDELGAA